MRFQKTKGRNLSPVIKCQLEIWPSTKVKENKNNFKQYKIENLLPSLQWQGKYKELFFSNKREGYPESEKTRTIAI